jgi:hypothetical protein
LQQQYINEGNPIPSFVNSQANNMNSALLVKQNSNFPNVTNVASQLTIIFPQQNRQTPHKMANMISQFQQSMQSNLSTMQSNGGIFMPQPRQSSNQQSYGNQRASTHSSKSINGNKYKIRDQTTSASINGA